MLLLVSNIPANFKSNELRNFFSSFIEEHGFEVFHYTHRRVNHFLNHLDDSTNSILAKTTKEDKYEAGNKVSLSINPSGSMITTNKQSKTRKTVASFIENSVKKLSNKNLSTNSNGGSSMNELDHKLFSVLLNEKKRCCCCVKVKDNFVQRFLNLYHRKFWIRPSGEVLPIRCLILDISLLNKIEQILAQDSKMVEELSRDIPKKNFKSKAPFSGTERELETCTSKPHGNVGTSNNYFKILLQQHTFPDLWISKLRLPMQQVKKKEPVPVRLVNGNTSQPVDKNLEVTFTGNGDFIPGYNDLKYNVLLQDNNFKSAPEFYPAKETDVDCSQLNEWERCQAFHYHSLMQEWTKEAEFQSEFQLVFKEECPSLVFFANQQLMRIQASITEEAEPTDPDLLVKSENELGNGDISSLSTTELDVLNSDCLGCPAFENKKICLCEIFGPNKTIYLLDKKKMGPIKSAEENELNKCNNFDPRYHKLKMKFSYLNDAEGASENVQNVGTFELSPKETGKHLTSSIQGWQPGQCNSKSGFSFPRSHSGQSPLNVPYYENEKTNNFQFQLNMRSRRIKKVISKDSQYNSMFEQHTKGTERLLESQGCVPGQGLSKNRGTSSPLENDDQLHLDKRGLVYNIKPSEPKAVELNLELKSNISILSGDKTSKTAVPTPKLVVVTPKKEVPATKIEVSTPKIEVPATKIEVSTPKIEVPIPKIEVTHTKTEVEPSKTEVAIQSAKNLLNESFDFKVNNKVCDPYNPYGRPDRSQKFYQLYLSLLEGIKNSQGQKRIQGVQKQEGKGGQQQGSPVVHFNDVDLYTVIPPSQLKEEQATMKSANDLKKKLREEKRAIRIERRKNEKIKLLADSIRISKDPQDIGTFEKHTKGIGSRILEAQGWKPGQGLGKDKSGSPFPVGNEGKFQLGKQGIGYIENQNTLENLESQIQSNENNLTSISSTSEKK